MDQPTTPSQPNTNAPHRPAAALSSLPLPEDPLRRANLELQQHLEAQTTQLARADHLLRQEMKERRRIESAFHESEERFMAFMNNSPTMAFIKDEHGRYIYGNERWETFFGGKLAPEKERNDFHLYPRKIAARLRGEDRQILATGKCSETVRNHLAANGRSHSWLVIKFPILDPHGRPFIGGIAVDITERKRAAAALKAHDVQQAAVAEFGQRALAGAAPHTLMEECAILVMATLDLEQCGIWELQPNGAELLLRAGVRWKHGLVGRATLRVVAGSMAAFSLNRRKPVISENLRAEKRFKPSSFLQSHGMVAGVNLVIPGVKKPFGLLTAHSRKPRRFSRDEIHFLRAIANVLAAALERKRAEEALRHSENTLVDFFDNAPLGLHWLGPDGRVLRANKAELRLLGCKAGDYIGHHISEFHADQDFIRTFLKKLHNNEPGTHEARLRTKDGSVKHVLIDANVFWENG
ncbi:MAG: Multi-sensor signal transduction histidine kinase, partial [Pedosphaera sp.]|nr:Multi-sensor signal transduction histidine kinase [Pedosphaera sp.]